MVEVLVLLTAGINLGIAVINLTVVLLSKRKKEKDFHSGSNRRKSEK